MTPSLRRILAHSLALLLTTLGLGWWAAPPARAADGPGDAAVPALDAAYLDRWPAHAMVVAVLRDGDVAVRGHGADAAGRPVDGDTPFRIASMSKSFTAALVAVLAERGVLDLDAPLTAAIPEFAMADDRAGRITLRMLLAHTSGLGGGSAPDLGRPENADGEALLANLRDATLGADPGGAHRYANTGYALAALAVERVTGRPFAEALREEVLLPLGLDATTTLANCAAPAAGVGSGHTVAYGRVLAMPEPGDSCLGSGGMISTARDVAAWLAFQAGDGTTPDGRRLLSAEALRDLHAAQPGTGNVDGYGLGWSFGEHDGVAFLEHGGALATWTSHMAIVRDADGRPTGDAALVLTDTIGAPSSLARALAAEAAGYDGALPGRPALSPALVFGALSALVVAAGVLGLARSSSWPRRRTRPATRAAGLVAPAALVALCVAAPALLARYSYGSPMPLPAAWHFGAAMLPEAMLLVALTGIVCAGVVGARLVALRRER